MSDVLDEYRQWQARWPARVWQTHYIGCYVHHHECMIHRLVDEVERLRNGALEGRETVTDHDAAPAATADADRERPDNPFARPGGGTGDTTREPVAWGVLPGGDLPLWRCRSREQAEARRAWLERQRPGSEPQVVPLVDGRAAPTLTDAERATLYHLRDWLRHIPDVDALLARLGGGE